MHWVLWAAGGIVVVGSAIATLYRGGRWLVAGLRKLFRLADEILGDDDRPGWGRRLSGIERRLSAVESTVNAQLQPNGGTSMHDKVTAIAEATGADRT